MSGTIGRDGRAVDGDEAERQLRRARMLTDLLEEFPELPSDVRLALILQHGVCMDASRVADGMKPLWTAAPAAEASPSLREAA